MTREPGWLELIKKRLTGPNPADYAEGFEDCRKEIAAYLDELIEFTSARRDCFPAGTEVHVAAVAVRSNQWRTALLAMRGARSRT